MSIEQKIVLYLADLGYITDLVAATAALEHQNIAEWLITGDGIHDEVEEAIESGEIEVEGGECNHEALTNEEIQEVFDNDEENKQNK